jgi:hypothetical protein
VCLDQHVDGTCGLAGRDCAIQRHWPAITKAVGEIESDRMDEYYAALESQVCPSCSAQDAQGRCSFRQTADCALYSYLSLVVNAIEQAKRARRELPVPFF